MLVLRLLGSYQYTPLLVHLDKCEGRIFFALVVVIQVRP